MSLQVGIMGGTGYTAGELLRLLHLHSTAEVTQISSRSQVGVYAHTVHPHMRGLSNLQFVHPDSFQPCDVLFLALPHGNSAAEIDRYRELAPVIVDLSADFRLNTPDAYQRWYGEPHPIPDYLERFIYGLPEINRESLRGAQYASGVGCNATVMNLALLPLARAGLLERVSAEIKVGSSEAGSQHSAASHHPVRSGAVRTYSVTGHRHGAEVEMVLGVPARFSVTAIEMVRGVHLLAHCDLNDAVTEKDIWKLYRTAYRDEPFVRLVNARTGLHRLPEPRIVAGTNFCDIGFEINSSDPRHLVVIAALDNLVKGAAGSAVQCMNLMCGFEETDGLNLIGVYP